MRKFLLLVSALLVLLYLSGASVYAQGKGNGSGPAAGQGRGPNDDHGNAGPGKAGKAREGHPAERESRIEERLEQNPALKTKVTGLLPPGTNLHDAAMGFKNEGQLIAALHVSKNLNIPFDQLKARMTGSNALSLGRAIHELRPDLSPEKANEEAKKARRQANQTEKTKTTT